MDKMIYEWTWDANYISKVKLSEHNLEVRFNPQFSIGTAFVRANVPMIKDRHHYWEIKMIKSVFGTDVMIGVGTNQINLTDINEQFCSLLGQDDESWGFSYKGYIQHAGERRIYTGCFREGYFVGVYFNGWKGTLEFFVNRKPLGIAFTGLRNKQLYPMVCSTASDSIIRLTHCSSVPASLQMECLSKLQPVQRLYISNTYPGLKYLLETIFGEILSKRYGNDDDDDDDDGDELFEFSPEFVNLFQSII